MQLILELAALQHLLPEFACGLAACKDALKAAIRSLQHTAILRNAATEWLMAD